jgi:hypothetical protein
MTARIYLEVVLVGLALIALPRTFRYAVAAARSVARRRNRRWLVLPGLGGALILVSMTLTVILRDRGVGTLALTEDARSIGLLCAFAFAGGIALRTAWWAAISVLAWTIAVALSQIWMVVQLGTTAYAARLQEHAQPTWYRFDASDVVGLTLIGSAPIALSASAGVLLGKVFWSRSTWRNAASAVLTLVVMISFVVVTMLSVDSNGTIRGETDREARLWFLALAVTPIVAAALGSWWAVAVIPLLTIAATLVKPAVAIQAYDIAAYQRDLPCRFMAISDPCTIGSLWVIPAIFALMLTLPLAFVGALIGKVIRLGRKRKRQPTQNFSKNDGHSLQPDVDAGRM